MLGESIEMEGIDWICAADVGLLEKPGGVKAWPQGYVRRGARLAVGCEL